MVTALLVCVCVVIELALQLADRGILFPSYLRALAYELGGFWPGLLDQGRPAYGGQVAAMFATYGFLHGGLFHLGVNMLTLIQIGPPVEARIGHVRFAELYALSALGGAVGYGFLAEGGNPMVGASGALFGLAGAILTWELMERRARGLTIVPVLRIVGFLLLLNLLLWWAMGGLLAWQAHLGGMLAGAFWAAVGPARAA